MTGQSIKVFNHHSTFVVLVSLLCEVIVNVFLLFFGCFDYYVVSPVSLLLPGEAEMQNVIKIAEIDFWPKKLAPGPKMT